MIYHEPSRCLVEAFTDEQRENIFDYVKDTWLKLDETDPGALRKAKLNMGNIQDNGEYLSGGRFAFLPTDKTRDQMPHLKKIDTHIKTYLQNYPICRDYTPEHRFTLFFSLSKQDQQIHEDEPDPKNDRGKCFLSTVIPVTPDEDATQFYNNSDWYYQQQKGEKPELVSPIFGGDVSIPLYSFPGQGCFHRGQRNKHDVRIMILVETRLDYQSHNPVFDELFNNTDVNLGEIFRRNRILFSYIYPNTSLN